LVQGICQDGRNRRAHLLQAGWRQCQIGSVGWHRGDFEPSATGKPCSYETIYQKELWEKNLTHRKLSLLTGPLSLLRFHQILRPQRIVSSFLPPLCHSSNHSLSK
jgi:hypothetical protein